MESFSLRTVFRWLVVGQLVLVVIAGIIEEATKGQLPPALRQYLEAEADPGGALLVLILVLAVVAIVLTVGLYRFSRRARLLYVALWPVGLILAMLMPPIVQTGIANALYSTAATISGIVIALAYFSPVAQEFERRAAPTTSSPAA